MSSICDREVRLFSRVWLSNSLEREAASVSLLYFTVDVYITCVLKVFSEDLKS